MEILDENDLIDEKDLLITIWTKPTRTLAFILKVCPKQYVTALLATSGSVSAVVSNYAKISASDHTLLVMIASIILGGLFGWLSGYIYAALLSWTGGWLNGNGTSNQFLTVVAWSSVPSICSLILLIPKFLIPGYGITPFDIHDLFSFTNISYLIVEGISLALTIWTIIILVKGVMLIQRFNTGKGILNAILPLLVLIIPILIIVGIAYMA